ncbi:MAG: HAMP domain-containing protein, partial [Planctomycetes bacterium]|nr:HAMP domain-containing protein [Planctomycetota bacterium]
MAGTWRIRHKLLLGMGLVAAIMALLLGGTLYGLASYRAAMGTCVRKMEEMRYAEHVKEEIRKLRRPTGEWALQERNIFKQVENVEKALEQYAVELQDTIDRGRAPNEGRQEQALVEILQKDMKELRAELKEETEKVRTGVQPGDFLDGRPTIRKKLEDAETHVNDLIGTITKVISTRVDITRDDARKSILLLSITGILAVLLMAGNLRFFYRWVAEPIRDLEEGVSRVARGDFEHRIEINSGDEIEDLAKAYND